ncbi:hypothetical protein M231_00685 [Tremella mesenterica]|uniref:Uncharacterized protein n=1 Tax=Tremella mesenterica TaxID=5217 RepID=A0A4Q1BUZ1_TREME|nr:hypothetical protein M231_00685 [Tremella mesenterica]
MILPEDTKPPILEDEEDLHFSPTLLYSPFPEPSSPSSQLTRPLLYSDDDIELGPAPPYSEHAESPPKSRHLTRRQIIKALVSAALTYLLISYFIGHFRRYRPWRGRFGNGMYDPPGEDESLDGTPIKCPSFDPADYSTLPPSDDQQSQPSPGEQDGYRRSTNVSFLLPTFEPELFAHLFGPATSDVFFTTYDPSTFTPPATAISDQQGDDDSYVHITVEAIYDVFPSTPSDEPSSVNNAPGWDWLMSSRICLMDRSRPNVIAKRSKSLSHPQRGLGVGVYTSIPSGNQDDPTNPPLSFRVHIALPNSSPRSFPVSKGLFDIANLVHPRPPTTHIHSFELAGAAGDLHLDLEQADLGELRLKSGMGQVMFESVMVEDLIVKATGNVTGNVTTAGSLFVEVPVGEIKLDLSLTHPPFLNKTVLGDEIPPVEVTIKAASNDVVLRYSGWEEGCTLSQDIFSAVGSVTVYPHPMYEGPYALYSSVGDVNVDVSHADIPDPLKRGRTRIVSVNHDDRVGSNAWTGEVEWRDVEERDNRRRWRPHRPPGMPGPGDRREKGINVKTSVGLIDLVF